MANDYKNGFGRRKIEEDVFPDYANMKRHGNLTEKTASAENIYKGWRESMKRKPKNRSRIRQMEEFKAHPEESLSEIQEIILSGNWPISIKDYNLFHKWQCGKLRDICWNRIYKNNVIMHSMIQVDGKILEDTLIADTFSGIKGRGPTKGLKRMEQYLSEYSDDQPIFCLKWDFRHYYDSIKRRKLLHQIKRKIKDKKSLRMHEAGIMICPGKGLPKGNLTSGIYSNFYLSPLDHHIKEELGFKHYARYCDDVVVLSSSKADLVALLADVREFIKPYGLEIKPNVQIFPIERNGIDFMGYVFHRHETHLRKRIERSIRKAVRRYNENPNMKNYKSLAAYWGWVKHITRPMAFWNAVVGKPLKELLPKEDNVA